MSTLTEAVLAEIRAAGYVLIKEKSYRQAQERQRVAEALRVAAYDDRDATRAWAEQCCAEERRLSRRLTFVYGVARAHGATVEELTSREES